MTTIIETAQQYLKAQMHPDFIDLMLLWFNEEHKEFDIAVQTIPGTRKIIKVFLHGYAGDYKQWVCSIYDIAPEWVGFQYAGDGKTLAWSLRFDNESIEVYNKVGQKELNIADPDFFTKLSDFLESRRCLVLTALKTDTTS